MKDLKSNGFHDIIAQAIEEMKSEQGNNFSLDRINLAELERRTGVSRAKLRRLKQNGFADTPHASQGRKRGQTILTGYTAILDDMLRRGQTTFWRYSFLFLGSGCPFFFSRENSFVQYWNPTAALLVFTVAPSGMASRHFRLAWAQQPQWVACCTWLYPA